MLVYILYIAIDFMTFSYFLSFSFVCASSQHASWSSWLWAVLKPSLIAARVTTFLSDNVTDYSFSQDSRNIFARLNYSK